MLFFLLLTLPFYQDPAQRGLEIAIQAEKANNGFIGEKSEMEMVLINAHGDQTVRKMTTEVMETEKDGDKSTSTFLWPADVKGTKVLTWTHKEGDDDQWLYLPALKRVKRISSSNKSGAFMGSEFAFEDLGSQEVEKYTYKFLQESDLAGRKTWVLERVPVSPKSGYSKEILWMDQEYFNPLKIEYYDRKGELLKVANFENYVQYGPLWRVNKIEMLNVQTKKKSIITWSQRELQVPFEDHQFDAQSLTE